jgi:hypothetical protein
VNSHAPPAGVPHRARRWLAISVLLLAGCGGAGGTGASYVGAAGDAAVQVTWTRSDRALSGQLTRAFIPDAADGVVRTERVGFAGTVYGSSVSLKLARGVGALTTLNGTLSGGS